MHDFEQFLKLWSSKFKTFKKLTRCFKHSLASSCFGFRNQGIMIAADNPAVYDGGKACGRLYKVTCLGGTNNIPNPCKRGEVTVKIVALCARCGADEISLSRDAFSRIANLKAGRVRVEYTQ